MSDHTHDLALWHNDAADLIEINGGGRPVYAPAAGLSWKQKLVAAEPLLSDPRWPKLGEQADWWMPPPLRTLPPISEADDLDDAYVDPNASAKTPPSVPSRADFEAARSRVGFEATITALGAYAGGLTGSRADAVLGGVVALAWSRLRWRR